MQMCRRGCGCIFSRSSSSFSNVRVVNINGYVQAFDEPISVSHVIGKPPQHFICTPAQLVSAADNPSLKPDTLLQPGNIYLMLPFSILHPDISSTDLISISKKLTAAAKSRRCRPQKQSGSSTTTTKSPRDSVCGKWKSPAARSPPGSGLYSEVLEVTTGTKLGSVGWSEPWKPILGSIKEHPMNQRSDSDLQEKCGRY